MMKKRIAFSSLSLVLVLASFPLLTGCPPAPAGVVYADVQPPAPEVDVVGVAPGPGYVWIAGHHVWRSGHYVWLGGRFELPPRGHSRWVAGHWQRSRRGWYFVEGHWR